MSEKPEISEKSDSSRDISSYLVIRDKAPDPVPLVFGRDRYLGVSLQGEVFLLFTTGEKNKQVKRSGNMRTRIF